MKKLILLSTLLVTLSLAISAGKGKPGGKPVAPGASITASPSVCTLGTPVSFSGSGFSGGAIVFITVQGPTFISDAAMADWKGNIYLDYPGGLNLVRGYYTVTAYQTTSKTTITASTGLEVQ